MDAYFIRRRAASTEEAVVDPRAVDGRTRARGRTDGDLRDR